MGAPDCEKSLCLVGEISVAKPFEDIVYSLRGGVEHVLAVEPVVAQLIENNLVGREIVYCCACRRLPHLFDGQQQGGLRKLRAMVSVFAISNGRYRKDEPHLWVTVVYQCNGFAQIFGTLRYAECLLVEKALWTLLAVVHNFASLLQYIYVVGAQCDDTGARLVMYKWHAAIVQQAFQSVNDTGRVVHHSVRIDHSTKPFLAEALPHVVGKA